MLKLPMWARVILGILAVAVCWAAGFFLPLPGEMGTVLLLPGAAVFIWLNPELWRGD